MNVRRGGLGRGLGALIPSAAVSVQVDDPAEAPSAPDLPATAAPATGSWVTDGPPTVDLTESHQEPLKAASTTLATVPGAHFAEIPVDAISPNPRQPRAAFDEEAQAELAHSIREIGLLQPVVVRPTGEPDRYELVMGERRWRAAATAGLERIPAIVRETGDDALLRDALLENLHRSQLNPLEEAAAYDQLLKDFGCSHDELAQRLGRSRPQVSNTLRLLRLPPGVQRRVAAGVLSAGHARALLGLTDPEAQERVAHRIVAEGLSVRAVEEIVTVGDDPNTTKSGRTRTHRPRAPGLSDLAERLSDRLETRVRVDLGRTKGRIIIDFASLDDLNRIVGVLDPQA